MTTIRNTVGIGKKQLLDVHVLLGLHVEVMDFILT